GRIRESGTRFPSADWISADRLRFPLGVDRRNRQRKAPTCRVRVSAHHVQRKITTPTRTNLRKREVVKKNSVAHFEIYADDPDKLGQFYTSLFDWTIEPVPQMDYRMIRTVET